MDRSGVLRGADKGRAARIIEAELESLFSGEEYADERAALRAGIIMTAGMPADVMIVTGERRLLQYLLRPITGILRRGLDARHTSRPGLRHAGCTRA